MNTFEITIQRKSKESWPVVVERSQPGVLLPLRSEGTFRLTTTDFEELQSLQRQPEEYGTFLGKALFKDNVRDAFANALGESPDGLRVLLFIEAEDIELRTLRWERLCVPKEGSWDFIRLDQRLPFALYIPACTDRRFPPIGKRDLRALVLAASPENLGKYRLDAFDVEAAVAGVRESLGEIPCDVLALTKDAIGPPTLDELCRQLTDRSKQYTLLHFIGHGKVIDGGETALYWANAQNQVEVVTGQKLIQQLRRLQGPRGLPHFAFLATCESASAEAEGALGGLGQRLVRDLGMPAVIAMTEKVSVTTALALGQRFYQKLLAAGYIDLGLDDATVGLTGRYDVTVPALFSRLAGQPLFSDSLDRPLTNAEITYGLEQLQTLLTERAPFLRDELEKHTKMLQGTLAADTAALRQEREQTLFEINTLSQEISKLSNALALGQSPLSSLEQLQTLLTERTSVLRDKLEKHTKMFQDTQTADTTALSPTVRQEREQTLFEINTLCQEISELSFNALALGKNPPSYDDRCPFLGLYPFHADDREFFFGREAIIKELHQELTEHHFLAVLGPSGSGKSSVVLAGVVPQMLAQSTNLQIAYLTPTHDPVAQLSTAQAVVQNQTALFVVDQFEELFTLCAEEENRQKFIEQLLSLSQLQHVVITMRADFWGECAPYEALKTLMKARQTLIGPMNTIELRAAMEQQAAKVGLRFEAGLSNTILDDVSGEPGAMPLLQHGLQELWKRRHGRWLNTKEYIESIGGIKQAIAKTADEVYHPLSPAEKSQFQNIFIRLTRLDESAVSGEGGRNTRRRVGLEELVPAGVELSATKALVKHLADARLVVTSRNAITNLEEVEVAHEALLRYWPRLANWLDENRTNLQLRETIRQAALTWEAGQKTADDLVHKGVRLEDAKVLARQTGFLNQLEADYVTACVALADSVERAASKRRRLTYASLTAGIIIALSLATFAYIQKNEVVKQKKVAETQKQLAAQAQLNVLEAEKKAESAKKNEEQAEMVKKKAQMEEKEAKAKLKQAKEKLQNVEEALNKAKASGATENQIKELEKKLAEAQQAQKESNDKMEAAKEQLKKAQEAQEAAAQKAKDLAEALHKAAQEAHTNQLRSETETQKALQKAEKERAEKIQKSLEKAQDDVKNLETQRDDAVAKANQAQEDAEKQRQLADDAQAKISNLNVEIETLQAEKTHAEKAQREKAQDDVKNLETQRDDAVAKANQAQKDAEKQRQLADEAQAKISELSVEIETQKERQQTMEERAEKTQTELEKTQNDLQKAQQTVKQLQSKLGTGGKVTGPRFVESNGTVTDKKTGLIWLTNANCVKATRDWNTARRDVTQLNTNGTMNSNNCGDTSNSGSHQIDWRLPNVKELQSLIDFSQTTPALPSGHLFSGVQTSSFYWSSTEVVNSTDEAWYVAFYQGGIVTNAKTDTNFVWPVRGGQ